ncbi:MAG TPA: CHAT domain-containing protein [Phnomibacter sp.]|nr:CHAT domain-containing protein [Phnomibacter sp.]
MKHNMVKPAAIWLVLLMLAITGHTQIQIRHIYVYIDSVMKKKDSTFLLLKGGSNTGLSNGKKGTVTARYLKEFDKEDQNELGFGSIVQINETQSLFYVSQHATIRGRRLQKDDLVKFEIRPQGAGQLFTELAARAIIFLDPSKVPHYDLASVMPRGKNFPEDSLLQAMMVGVKETAEMLRPNQEPGSVLITPIQSGLYQGRSIIGVMDSITAEDAKLFLRFVISYPGKYMGYSYKFNETFATWLLNGAPPGSLQFYPTYQLLQYNDRQLTQWLKKNAAVLRKEKFTSLFYDEAVTYTLEGKNDSAGMAIQAGMSIANTLNDTIGKASLWQAKAQILQDAEKYAEAIQCTDSTIYYAAQAKDYSYWLNAYFKKAYCLYKSSMYPKGRAVLAEAENVLRSYASKMSSYDSLDFWRKRYEYEGWINYSAGENEVALKNMYQAIAINSSINTQSATENIANDYWYIGKIFKQQGFYEKSLQAFDSSYLLFKKLNIEYSIAYTENDIGRVYYSMGKYPQSMEYHNKAFTTMMKLKKWDNAGYAKSMMGSNLEMQNDIKGSIAAHEEAIDLRRKANNKDGQAFSWKTLGKLYENTGNKSAALKAYDSAAFFYAAIGDTSQQAQNLLNIGKVYQNDKDFRKATTYYERAAAVLKRLQSKTGYIDALYKLGSANWEIDEDAAAKYYTQCMQEAQSINDQVNELYSMINLGALAGKKNNFEAANGWMEKALPLALATKDPAMEASCYQTMGSIAEMKMKVPDAFDYYRKASRIYDTLDRPKYFKTQLRIASLYLSSGKFDSSATINKKVIEQAAKLGYSLEQGDALIALAFQYTLQARYKEGLALSDSAERVFALTGNNGRRAAVLASKALQQMGLGLYEASIVNFNKADSLYALEKNIWDQSVIANNTGVAYTHQGAYRTAIHYFKKSLALRPLQQADESSMRAQANIGECYMYLKQPDSALAILQSLYPTARQANFDRLSSSMAILMGRIYTDKKMPDKAQPLLEEALQGGKKRGMPDSEAEALMYLGKLNKASNPAQALEQLKTATAISDSFQLNMIAWEVWFELGEYYYEHQQYPEAIAAYKKSVALIEKNSANIYGGEDARKTYQSSGKKPELYTRLISSLSATGATEEAWAFAQKTQQEAIKDLLGNLNVPAGNAEKSAALQKLVDLQQKRNGLDQNIKQLSVDGGQNNNAQLKSLMQTRDILEKEYLNYVTQLVKTYPDIDGYFSKNVNPEDFKDVKESIPNDVAIVLYLLNGKQLLTFTATNKKIGVKEQMLTSDLEPLVDRYIQTLSNPAKTAAGRSLVLRSTIKKTLTPPAATQPFPEMADQLYGLLIAPIENEIKDVKSLCIIPNGKLSNLPFQCLAKKTNNNAVRYLIEDYSVFYTNKLTVFLKAGRKDRSLASFTGFGNPDKSLASAGKEVEAIGAMLHTQNIYLQDLATESKAKSSLETSKYIHFATHGVLNYTDFSSSYLKMANVKDGNEDGELRIDEIKSLGISGCELVTLSACETAVNQELKKGWYISPANAFLVSSVRSVVASLWAVDDEATNLLMQELYKNLQTMDKVAALRKAQATLSATPGFEHPFYWGAFVLYGDWR